MGAITDADAHARFDELLNQVVEEREPVIITRLGQEPVALIAADDLNGLMETVQLLRSRTNAERLLAALARAKAREGTPTSLAAIKSDIGLTDE